MVTALDGIRYAGSQVSRVAWYYGQYLLSFRLSRQAMPAPRRRLSTPGREAFLKAISDLLYRDWDNIRTGVYRMPHDRVMSPVRAIGDALAYFRDLPAVNDRRRRRGHSDVIADAPRPKRPRYYLQNFHFQTDGYLSHHSARLYDHQVEILFGGAADAMRRQALVPLHDFLRGRNPRQTRLLDIASGTGRFLTFVLDNFPDLRVTALDLSEPYLREARRSVARFGRARYLLAQAEQMPLADASQDLATCIYLFHELPRKVRVQVAAEIGRVLKPGGRLVMIDSLQRGDRSDFDGMLEYFPQAFHEPYYDDYTRHDLIRLFEESGLAFGGSDLAFMSKVLVFEKPA